MWAGKASNAPYRVRRRISSKRVRTLGTSLAREGSQRSENDRTMTFFLQGVIARTPCSTTPRQPRAHSISNGWDAATSTHVNTCVQCFALAKEITPHRREPVWLRTRDHTSSFVTEAPVGSCLARQFVAHLYWHDPFPRELRRKMAWHRPNGDTSWTSGCRSAEWHVLTPGPCSTPTNEGTLCEAALSPEPSSKRHQLHRILCQAGP